MNKRDIRFGAVRFGSIFGAFVLFTLMLTCTNTKGKKPNKPEQHFGITQYSTIYDKITPAR